MAEQEETPEHGQSQDTLLKHNIHSPSENTLYSTRMSVDIQDLASIITGESKELSIGHIFSLESESDIKKESTEEKEPDEQTLQPGSRRESVQFVYAQKPRYNERDSIRAEDFMEDVHSFRTFTSMESFTDLTPPVLSKHSDRESLSEEQLQIDRTLYYQLHDLYTHQLAEAKRKNNYLQMKLADYYKSKRMYHVLYTDPNTVQEGQRRYEKQLDELYAVTERCEREKSQMLSEIQNLKHKFRARKTELQNLFEKLEKLERDYSKELTNPADESSKKTAEKFIERYLRRQKNDIESLKTMRLAHIKLKNKYNETQEMLDSLDNLGPNLRLIDYEQLKTDNRNLSDKLEEKINMLIMIRKQCQHTMQVLAHTREKVNAVELDITSFKDRLDSVTEECLDVRDQVGHLKRERDLVRRSTGKLKDEVGLLIRPHLLRDMELAVRELEDGNSLLQKYKEDFNAAKLEMSKLRRMHASSVLMLLEGEKKNLTAKSTTSLK